MHVKCVRDSVPDRLEDVFVYPVPDAFYNAPDAIEQAGDELNAKLFRVSFAGHELVESCEELLFDPAPQIRKRALDNSPQCAESRTYDRTYRVKHTRPVDIAQHIFYAGSYGLPVYAVNRIDKRVACADDSVAQDLSHLRPVQLGQKSAQRADGNREF